jgi:hypothetical protein
MIKKRIFFYSLLFISTTTLYPISQKTALIITGVAGGVSTIGSYIFFDRFKFPVPFVLSGLTGGVTSAITYWICSGFTPEGRYARAKAKMDFIARNPIALHPYTDDKLFFNALQEIYIADEWYLVSAFNELTRLLEETQAALRLVDEARSEAADNYNLVQQCNALSPRLRAAFANLTDAIKKIRSNQEYLTQQAQYKQWLAAEKQLQVQREIAAAERDKATAQYQMAQAQKEMAQAKREMVDIKGVKTAVEIMRRPLR